MNTLLINGLTTIGVVGGGLAFVLTTIGLGMGVDRLGRALGLWTAKP